MVRLCIHGKENIKLSKKEDIYQTGLSRRINAYGL